MSERVLYSLAEVAQLLGVHYETVARWVRAGKLRGIKLSRRKVVVAKEELDALLAGDARGAGKAAPAIGSPQRWLALIRTLTPYEAEKLRASVQDFEQVEAED
jgi:excisionase family DNA binding protein